MENLGLEKITPKIDYQKKETRRQTWLFILATFIVICFLFPVLWMFLTSIKTRLDAFAMPPVWMFKPTLENYRSLLLEEPFFKYLWNSFFISSIAAILAGVLGTPTAYALSRFKFKGKNLFAFWILASRIAPPMALVLPFFIMFRAVNLVNSYLSIIILYMTLNLAFVVWMMRGYFEQIPVSIEEAAKIDGCSIFGTLRRVTLPLVSQGLSATMVFCFMANWSEFVLALIFTGIETRTAPVLISGFVTVEGIRWGMIGAAGTIVNLPVIIFAMLLQKYFVTGLTSGAVKS
jgi:multiple sugar transport system permease protein